MKRKYIYFIFIFLLLISCDYGFKSGEDLHYGWSTTGCIGGTETYEFYEDGTGLKILRYSTNENEYYSEYSFDYQIVPEPEECSKVILTNIKKNGDYIDKKYDDERYNYYFNAAKDNLYMNQYKPDNSLYWKTYQKINYKYKDNYKDKFTFKE